MGKYVVIAGVEGVERPPFVEGNFLEKNQGQTMTVQGQGTLYVNKKGDIGFPNRTEAWGRRVVNGKSPEDGEKVEVTDKDYNGKIEFLPWGHQDGMLIVCRYLKGYSTLDQQYQNLVLNADENIRDTDESSADAYFLRLQTGENVFNEKDTDPYFVQMLKISGYNSNSVSKSPDYTNSMFHEKREIEESTVVEKNIDAKFEALKIVNEAVSDNSYSKLRNLHMIVRDLLNEEVKDEYLSSAMKGLADSDARAFMDRIESHKIMLSKTLEMARSYQLFDLTTDGVIVANVPTKSGASKKEIIGEDIHGKKDSMIDWVFSNFLDKKASDVAFRIKQITDKIK